MILGLKMTMTANKMKKIVKMMKTVLKKKMKMLLKMVAADFVGELSE